MKKGDPTVTQTLASYHRNVTLMNVFIINDRRKHFVTINSLISTLFTELSARFSVNVALIDPRRGCSANLLASRLAAERLILRLFSEAG